MWLATISSILNLQKCPTHYCKDQTPTLSEIFKIMQKYSQNAASVMTWEDNSPEISRWRWNTFHF